MLLLKYLKKCCNWLGKLVYILNTKCCICVENYWCCGSANFWLLSV